MRAFLLHWESWCGHAGLCDAAASEEGDQKAAFIDHMQKFRHCGEGHIKRVEAATAWVERERGEKKTHGAGEA